MNKIILSSLILAVGIGGAWFLWTTRDKPETVESKEQVALVNVMQIAPDTLAPTVVLYGRIETPNHATLRTPSLSVATEVTTVPIREGQLVTEGQVLVQLDDRDSQLTLQQRKADVSNIDAQISLEKQQHANNVQSVKHEENLLKLLEKNVERASKLKSQRVGSASALDDARQAVERQMLTLKNRRTSIRNHQARLAQLQAQRQRAIALRNATQLEIDRTRIVAPFAGIIAQVDVAIGDRVRSGDVLLSLYDNMALEVRAQIPRRFQGDVLTGLESGQPLTAHAQLDQNLIHLQLDRVAGEIQRNSGGIDGLFTVVEGSHFLRLGQFLNLALQLPVQPEVVALPYEAIYGKNRIYKLAEERMQAVIVERIGEQVLEDGSSQILLRSQELAAGDQVVITPLPNAVEGLKVQVSEVL